MRVIPPRALRGGALPGRHFFPRRSLIAASRAPTTVAFTRHQSTTSDRTRASPWAQHSLPVSVSRKDGLDASSKPTSPAIHKAYIALGSNLGDRVGWIEKACNEMSARKIKILRTSSLWETEPMYVLDQDSFINGACEVGSYNFQGSSAALEHVGLAGISESSLLLIISLTLSN